VRSSRSLYGCFLEGGKDLFRIGPLGGRRRRHSGKVLSRRPAFRALNINPWSATGK
jgi:hypothetical protein